MAREVQLRGGTGRAKVRSVVWVIVWTFLTLGIYGMYWWYQVNRELRDLGRIHGSSELGDSPGLSLLAVTLGWLVIVPPFVSIYKGTQRIQAAQRLAGIPEAQIMNGWLMLGLLVVSAVIYIPFGVGFVQSEMNKIWASDGMVVGPDEAAPLPPAAAAPAPAAPSPPGPAPGAAAVALGSGSDPQLERLERLAGLRDSGALTPEEYEAQKAKILDEL